MDVLTLDRLRRSAAPTLLALAAVAALGCSNYAKIVTPNETYVARPTHTDATHVHAITRDNQKVSIPREEIVDVGEPGKTLALVMAPVSGLLLGLTAGFGYASTLVPSQYPGDELFIGFAIATGAGALACLGLYGLGLSRYLEAKEALTDETGFHVTFAPALVPTRAGDLAPAAGVGVTFR